MAGIQRTRVGTQCPGKRGRICGMSSQWVTQYRKGGMRASG